MAKRPPSPRNGALYARRVTSRYASSLRKIAKHIADFGKSVSLDRPETIAEFINAMNGYARVITPWARAQGARMAGQVDQRDKQYWKEYAADMGSAVRHELETAPTGRVMRESIARQVDLITSLPTEAAENVHQLALGAVSTGMRAAEVSDRIILEGKLDTAIKNPKARANTIARTEVSRAQTEFYKARAAVMGSTQYIWRTVGDARVRDTHEAMEGMVCDWAHPPAPEGKQHYHPGCFPNCRCWAEAILPEED